MTAINSKELGRFVKFMLIGGLGTVIDFGIFNLLADLFAVPPIIASICSFSCAVINNFVLNRLWTFKDSRTKTMAQQFVQFVIVSVIGLAIRTPFLAWLIKVFTNIATTSFHFSQNTTTLVANNLALACVVGVVMIWNFIANRLWTFNDVK
ncbi:MAG: GtrA family protein [Anaerolineaceae bacterium]|jgi:putative flippase GtrA